MELNPKNWYTSKTVWYAILSGIAMIVTAFYTQYPDIAVLGTINSIITIALRFTTVQPIQ